MIPAMIRTIPENVNQPERFKLTLLSCLPDRDVLRFRGRRPHLKQVIADAGAAVTRPE